MPDKDSKTDSFNPQQPRIPRLLYEGSAEKAAEGAPASALLRQSSKAAPVNIPPTWIICALVGALVLGGGVAWWSYSSSTKQLVPKSETQPAVKAADSPKLAEKLTVAPGEVATTEELAKPWSSKRFIFRDVDMGKETPAMVVHLPGGTYWAFSLREPFGTCELEFVTDLQKLATEYHYRAAHPMVGDPCNRVVFDLTRYGTAPSGLVRGEVAQGAGVRPPMAIEIRTQGNHIMAVRMERF